jgi:Family of unknown function (DUF6011)
MMNSRERQALDNHITGHYGEDQFRGQSEMFADHVDAAQNYPTEGFLCQVCGLVKTEGQWMEDKGNVCSDCLNKTTADHDTEMLRGRITDATAANKLMYAGNCYFTVVSLKTNQRFTFRVAVPRKARAANMNDGSAVWYYVSVLNGPDNESNYEWLGTITSSGEFRYSGRVGAEAISMKTFIWLRTLLSAGRMPTTIEWWHEGRCCRCGRKLTVPSSISSGVGPECIKYL